VWIIYKYLPCKTPFLLPAEKVEEQETTLKENALIVTDLRPCQLRLASFDVGV
jgi:hypothetical protein